MKHAVDMDSEGARSRSHELTAVWPELGLRWLESAVTLHIAGPELPAGQHHTTPPIQAPTAVGRGTRDGRSWTGSKAENHGGPDQAGQGRAEP